MIEKNEIKSLAHSKYRCQYHIVFAPKYRRKEIYGQLKKDIGEILANNIVSYFQEEKNIELINNLKELGINMDYKGEKTLNNSLISNKKFVITGTISFMSRDEIKALLEKYDGTAVDSVSKKTDVVIVGDSPGSKYDKALKLGIEIWNEDKLKEVIDSL